MNKAELRKFAMEARRDLLEKVSLKAEQYGITKDNHKLRVEENYGQLFVNDKPYPVGRKHAFNRLQQHLNAVGYEQLIEEVAYTWFNRIIAIRYMEVNNYLPDKVNVLSSTTDKNEPDILIQYETLNLDVNRQKINDYLRNGDIEQAYRKLFVAQCNSLNKNLSTLFEKINDYTELLLPDYLLDSEFVISKLVSNHELTVSFKEVEVIGWLYQYYNAEPKDKVFNELKRNKKVEKHKIPAATQLFTPKWIVKYMVENSLGQLWLESNPNSPIKEEMTYYIEASDQEEDVKQKLKEIQYTNVDLEEITIIDPCCGSGHILVYAFELLYRLYEEAGYPRGEIPKLILEKNLFGLDIDYRAVQLSSFALIMKAREKSRRIFKNNINVNVFEILETNNLDIEQIIRLVAPNNHEEKELRYIYNTFIDAKNFGSLIIPSDIDYGKYLEKLKTIKEGEFNLENYHVFDQIEELRKIILLCKILNDKYDVSITNPPYMGRRKAMNNKVKKFVETYYPNSKFDLYACFIERCITFSKRDKGLSALVTQHSFMFTDDYKGLRELLLDNTNFLTMCHLGAGSFPEISGEIVQTTSFVLRDKIAPGYKGKFIRLVDYKGSSKSINVHNKQNHFQKYKNADFKEIQGFPISYWMSTNMKKSFSDYEQFEKIGRPRQGLATGENERFVRYWSEVNYRDIGFHYKDLGSFHNSKLKYVPYNKGGKQRKWYGNNDWVLKFDKEHYKILEQQGNKLPSRQHYFQKSITWSDISGRNFAARYCDNGFVFDVKGSSGFPDEDNLYFVLAFLNSCLTPKYIDTLNPTLTTQVGDLKRIPVIDLGFSKYKEEIDKLSIENVEISKEDWDNFEVSWGFTKHPLLKHKNDKKHLTSIFDEWKSSTENNIMRLKENEEQINRILINLYDLQDELSPEVESKPIHLSTANREDDSKSFLSYFVGCVMGRYSLNLDCLAYAGGEFNESMYESFKPNKDGVIQLTDNHYFDNDIIVRLREFLSIAFSPDTVDENMYWLAESLKIKKSESPEERLRRYFLDEFFKDHCKTYQKRPIYWLVDSGKQKGLRTLIYMHRYQQDTMATIRFEHLQEIQSKYQNEIDMIDTRLANPSLSPADKRNLEKTKTSYQKRIEELQGFDKKLAIYANEQMDIDLDKGVKVNYAKFDDVLAKIK